MHQYVNHSTICIFSPLSLHDALPICEAMFGIHPHSGIATLTVVLSGEMVYEDTTGKSGQVSAGGLEWMKAGGGVWHGGHPTDRKSTRLNSSHRCISYAVFCLKNKSQH